jgi:hypothetical protein
MTPNETGGTKPVIKYDDREDLLQSTPMMFDGTPVTNLTYFAVSASVDDLTTQTVAVFNDSENEISFDPTTAHVETYTPKSGPSYALGSADPVDWSSKVWGKPGRVTFKPDYAGNSRYCLYDETGEVVWPLLGVSATGGLDSGFQAEVVLITPPGKPDYYTRNPHPVFPQSATAEQVKFMTLAGIDKDLGPHRGNPSGLPVEVYFWTTEQGTAMMRLTGRGQRTDGRPMKTGILVNVTDLDPVKLRVLMGEAMISLLHWTCRETSLAGDMTLVDAAHGGGSLVPACDISETGEYPEQVVMEECL